MVAFDSGLFERPVHSLDLSICPRMIHFGEAMFYAMLCADTVKDVWECVFILLTIGELNAVICQDSVDVIGNSTNKITQKLCSFELAVFFLTCPP